MLHEMRHELYSIHSYGMPMTATLTAECPQCGRMGKGLSHCNYCGEFIPMTLANAEVRANLMPHDRIRALFHLVPEKNGWKHPQFVVCGQVPYRGKLRFVAGYSHARIGAHHMSGLCYDRILGYGESQDQAIAMME